MTAVITALDSEPADASVIVRLEEALVAAREGRFSAVAMAFVYRDGSTGDSWSEVHSIGTLIGAVSLLHTRLCRIPTDKD